jgi:hypothetical protein
VVAPAPYFYRCQEKEMKYTPPKQVELLNEESKWFKTISSMSNDNKWQTIADAMQKLTKSLLKRNAIPEIRLRLFSDPDLAETRSKSSMQIFESNGVTGDAIFRHPHFVKYLHFFINGPELPAVVIKGFCKILNEDMGTSGMLLDQLCKFVRSCVRDNDLDRRSAATEFYRLAVELDIEHDPRTIRKASLSAR